jgi:PAS domain S-box-containing protein
MGYPLTLLYFASFVALVVVATATAMVMPSQPAKHWTVWALGLGALWALADFASNLATTAAEVALLARLLSPSWALLPYATLQAAVHYAGATRWTRPLAMVALALPVVGCVLLAASGRLVSHWTPAPEAGGYFVVHATLWQLPVDLYFVSYFGAGALLLFTAARRTGLGVFRRPARIFAFVFGPAALVAAAFEGVMQQLGRRPPHIASLVVTSVAIWVGTRLLRHQFFEPLSRLRRWAETAVRTSDDRYQVLLETAPDAVGLVDEAGRLLRVNTSTARVLGFDAATELLHARPTIWGSVHEDDRDRARRAAMRATMDGTCYGVEIRGVTRDGGIVPLEVSVGALPVRSGTARTFVYSARNISERLRAAEERQQLAEQMLQAQKLESLGLLAAGIAHDFNNILLAVGGNAGLARRRLSAESPARPFVETIEQAAHAGALLTRQLLTYAGRSQRKLEPVDLSTFTQEMTELMRLSVHARVQIDLDLADDLPLVRADVGQIQQVVMNLLTNAAEAVGTGPGHIRVRTSCLQVGLDELYDHTGAAVRPGRYVRLDVADTGTGIAREDRHRIFDPFFTTKRVGQGLGLAAVLGIVQGHGGALTLHSEPGAGTSFGILLPAPALEAVAPVASAQDATEDWAKSA